MKIHAFTSCATKCIQGSTSTLKFVGDDIYVFDLPSRNKAGEQVLSGSAVLIKFNSCNQYCMYLQEMLIQHKMYDAM